MTSLTVLGLGNILMTDEGVGVRLMEAVRDLHPWPQGVEFIDGGAGGLGLLNIIERSERLVVFDAADMSSVTGLIGQRNGRQLKPKCQKIPAGQSRIITADQLLDEPAAGQMSMHDMPFAQTLALCRQFTSCPEDVTILAIQPADISPGRQLSPVMQLAFKTLLQASDELVQGKLA